MSNSLMSNERECLICGTSHYLHKHHIFFGTDNRKKSDEDGCWCWLCARHHNMSDLGVHYNKTLDNNLKMACERKWLEKNNASIEDFIKRYGRNYL